MSGPVDHPPDCHVRGVRDPDEEPRSIAASLAPAGRRRPLDVNPPEPNVDAAIVSVSSGIVSPDPPESPFAGAGPSGTGGGASSGAGRGGAAIIWLTHDATISGSDGTSSEDQSPLDLLVRWRVAVVESPRLTCRRVADDAGRVRVLDIGAAVRPA